MTRPNLLFVLADQLRLDACGYVGSPVGATPNIDRFAGESADFTNAVSGYPVCGPYRNSLFTGKYPSSTGMVINELRCMPDDGAISHVLTRAGYDTHYIGKWHLYGRDHTPEEQYCPPGPHRLGFDGYWASYNFHHRYYSAFYYEDTSERREVDGYEPDVHTDMLLERLTASDGDRPFAAILNYGVPHDPWTWDNVPEEHASAYRDYEFGYPRTYREGSAEYWSPRMGRAWWRETVHPDLPMWQQVYHAMIANLDWNFGRVLDGLDRLGLADDTLVVFTSDHGEMFGAHGRIAKKIFYEEAVRVPFLMRLPGVTKRGSTDACLDTPDIMPTLLGLLGLNAPDSVEGMDLSHCARGESGPEPDAALMQGMGHTYQWLDGDEWRALRDKRYTYAIAREGDAEYLFDNVEDPFQELNLASDPDHRAVARDRREQLRSRMARLNDDLHPTTYYRDAWTRDRCVVRSAARSAT
ncbi:hypothetical protein CMK11_11590 [Candidatus Poribacteria bacterium]|nr:hypothetical protein [Candidatus Poribacteria bacterium]